MARCYPDLMRPADIRSELPALLHLAWPLILGELGWMAMSIVDTVMVGRLPHSAIPLAAASLAQVLFNTFTFGVSGILLGLDALISQAFGAHDLPAANRWLLHGILMAMALSAVLIALFAFGPALLAFLPIDRGVLAIAMPALSGLDFGVLPLLLYFTFRRYLQAGHHVRPIAFALVSANLVNAAGDWLLLYGHRWALSLPHHPFALAIPAFGVVGSSWATSFARLYMMAVLLFALLHVDRRHGYGLRATRWRLDPAPLRQLFALGAPVGGQIFVEISVFATVTTLMALFGPLPLAGHEVALQCASTTWMVPFAISTATAVRVGNAIGRLSTGIGSSTEIAAAGWSGILAGAAFMLLTSIAFLSAPAAIARLFTPDRGVIAAAVPLLLVAAGFQFFDGVQVTASGALRGSGNTLAPLVVQLACYWALAIPLGAWLAFRTHLGPTGLWWGLFIGLAPAALLLLEVWRRVARGFAAA